MNRKNNTSDRQDHIRLMAHRGFTPYAPQNSLPAFLEAGRRNFWAIETDVRMTVDGHLVCIHDETVDSLYMASGAVAEMTLNELRALVRRETKKDYPEQYMDGGTHRWNAQELCVPLYSQYLQICRACKAVPFIELKTDDVMPVMEETARFFHEEEVIMSSSVFSRLEQVRKLTDKMFVHHIFSNEDYLDTLARWGRSGHAYNYSNLDEVPDGLIERDHERGVCVCLRAGDSLETVYRMAEMGLDYIPTNKVDPIMLIGKERGGSCIQQRP